MIKPMSVLLVCAGLVTAMVGCAGNRTVDPRAALMAGANECRLGGVRPGQTVVVILKDGKRLEGRYGGIACRPDTTIALAAGAGSGGSPDTSHVRLAQVEQIVVQEPGRRGFVSQVPGIMLGTFLMGVLVAAIVQGVRHM